MPYEFIVCENGTFYNTYNFNEIDPSNSLEKDRLERKYSIRIFPHIIYLKQNVYVYKYDVTSGDNAVRLTVYRGRVHKERELIEWTEEYRACCRPDTPFIQEEGSKDILYWYEFFGENYNKNWFDHKNIADFELTPHTMSRVREVFPCELCDNPVYFFLKHKYIKQKYVTHYPPEMFKGIPYPKINKNVGKACDSEFNENQIIHYAWQSEITIKGIPFLDVVVISGFVKNGIMDIADKHRFFLAEDFVYSPDGGDFGVFASKYFFGRVFTNKLKKTPNHLLLDSYSGQHFYKYMFSKYYIPAFELTAKAGYSLLADQIIDAYYKGSQEYYYRINYFGKNDKEIFGFKFKYLKSISDETIASYAEVGKIISLFNNIKEIVSADTSLLKDPVDDNLFEFIKIGYKMPNIHKRIEYLRSIGTDKQSMYRDYLRMCDDAGKYADGQGQFPANLSLAHDSMVAYMNQVREAKNNLEFDKKVSAEQYTESIYIPEGETYCILAPRHAKDLVFESYKLSHCVRTYIKDVALDHTKIYFLREQETKSKPLVTIEVKGKNIVQARGKCNRKITSDEQNFIQRWAKIKGLNYKVIYYW